MVYAHKEVNELKKLLDKVLDKGFITPYSEGELTFSCSKIEMEIETGHVVVGSFRITTEDKYKPEGYVYCDDLRMLIRTKYFVGLDLEIGFQYDSTGMAEGSVREGVISIVSNLGEYELPYSVQITSLLPVTMMGTVKNLFHFANLSRLNWNEALSLFYSKQFVNILTGNDFQYRNIYRGLSGYQGNEINLDQFLEYVRKKQPSEISVNTESITLENPSRDITKTVIIRTANWGHSPINVYAKGDFIQLDKEVFEPWKDEDTEEYQEDYQDANLSDADENTEVSAYENGRMQLKVLIERDRLCIGENKGEIIISDFNNEIIIPVEVNIRKGSRVITDLVRKLRMDIMELYIEYRLGHMDKMSWLKACNSIIGAALISEPDNIEYRLYQVHIMLLEKRLEDASRNLEFTGALINTEQYEDTIVAYYNYLKYISTDDADMMEQLTRENELMYVRNVESWRLAWLLMYMKDDYAKDASLRYELVKGQYESGNASPVMFLEALNVIIESPQIMNELSEFEFAILSFVIKHGVMTKEIRNRFVFIASRENAFSDEVFDLLVYCYQQEEDDETLTQICTLLMKGNRMGVQYFPWYEKAVEKELRINRLYEYYIMSIDLKYNGRLPKLVLMYFAYRSNLDYERNAFLYANILRHKAEYQDIYNDYENVIKQFAENEILKGRINDNLAFIYRTIIGERLYEPEFATEYAAMLFLHRITVKRAGFVKVVVVNGYLKEENHYSIYNSQVVLPLVGSSYSVFLEDKLGNRYADTSLYDIERVVKDSLDVTMVMGAAALDLYPALYLADTSKERITVTEENENALVWLSYSDSITDEFKIEIMLALLEYYFEKDEIGRLDEFLVRFDPAVLNQSERERCVRILVARGMYDTAFDWIKKYGIEGIDYKILVRLCDRILTRTDNEYDLEILKICQYIFKLGKYDESILKYLISYAGGLTKELKGLWRAADSFSLDVHSLLENMIIQLLYSGDHVGEEENIFKEYVARGANLELEKLFMDKLSYDYFILERNTDVKVFDRLVYYHQMGEEVSDYAMLAYLKKSVKSFTDNTLSHEERAIILMFLRYMDSIQVYFPFFMEYNKLWPKLEIYQDRCFIEYRGREGNKVILHYVIEKNDEESEEYVKEEMPHMKGGIFVWSYVLFFGERIRYYITEEESRQEKLTQSSVLERTNSVKDCDDTMYGMINNMVISRDMKDDLAFIHLADEYSKKKFIVDNIFTPYERDGKK